MTLQKKIIGRVQTDHGTYDPNQSYGKKFQVQLFGCVWESLHDNNNTAPAVWDGGDIITPNTTDWKKASGDYQSWLLKQNHPATTGTTGDYPYNGMGRVELAKNMVNTGTDLDPVMVNQLTQDMFYKGAADSRTPNTNTIFVIRYDYVLAENIAIPDGCVLQFDGGSISGAYTLTLADTYIEGNAKFNSNITFAGTISNDMFNVLWIENGDLGAKVNKVALTFKNILIPEGEFVFTTPIAIEEIKKLISNATLKYNGEYINNTGVFKIKKAWAAYIYIYHLIPNDVTALDFTDTRTINAAGVEIQTCNNCEIHVMRVQYFNENLRISDINHSGCCYNKFFIGVLASGNFNIRLYQHDSPDGISWTNENTFIGGRLTHWTDEISYGDYWNIGVGGPQIDKPSYKTSGAVDNENTCNGLTFVGTSIETNRKSVLLYNVSDCQFIGMREETTTGFAKIIGNCQFIYYIPKFTNVSNFFNSDLSEADVISLINYAEAYNVETHLKVDDNLSPSDHLVKFTGFINGNPNRNVYTNYLAQIGLTVSLSTHCCFAVRCNKKTRIAVRLIDSNGNNVTPNHTDLKLAYQMSYNSTHEAYRSTADTALVQFHIPPVSGVSKVFVGTDAGNGIEMTFLSNFEWEAPSVPIKGDTASRPKALPTNVAYLDTTLEKLIYTKSTNYNNQDATVWMDAVGNIVT